MNPVKLDIPFVHFEGLKYITENEKCVIFSANYFTYHSEYTLLVKDDLKGEVEQYHNYTYEIKRTSIVGFESDYSDGDDAWYCDLLIYAKNDFRIWFKTVKQIEEFKQRLKPYIFTEVFEMKPLLQ